MAFQFATSSKQLTGGNIMTRVRAAQVEQPFLVHAPVNATCTAGSRYAILKLGGVRQMVEEGQDYTCPKRFLQEARVGDASERIVFQNIVGLRSDGQFRWGKPFVADAAVEVEMLEEFAGPIVTPAAGVAEADTDVTMARYRVKAISTDSGAAAHEQ